MESLYSLSIVVATRPRLMLEMLQRAIQAALPDVDVVAADANANQLLIEDGWSHTQWLIVTLTEQGSIPLQAYQLLAQHPTLSILALSADGSRAEIQTLQVRGYFHRAVMSNITLATLLAILQNQSYPHRMVFRVGRQ